MNLNNNISEHDWELLEDYLSGNMPMQQQEAFKARLEAEPALQEARLFITGMKEAMLTEKLDAFHNIATEKIPSIAPKRNFRTYWMAAASVVIIVTVSGLLFFNSNNDEKLAAAYFEPDPGLPTTMGSGENYSFDRGMLDYKAGKYAGSIETWRPLMVANPANDTLHYFSGIAFLALGKADSATHHLQQVWNTGSSSFHADAGWYLALSLLSQGKKEEAKLLLQQSNHPKKEELLSHIK